MALEDQAKANEKNMDSDEEGLDAPLDAVSSDEEGLDAPFFLYLLFELIFC